MGLGVFFENLKDNAEEKKHFKKMENDESYRLEEFEYLRNSFNNDGSAFCDMNVAFLVIKSDFIPESLHYDWLKYMGIDNPYEFMRGYNQLKSQGKLENPDAVAKFLVQFIKLEDQNDNFFDDAADDDDWDFLN